MTQARPRPRSQTRSQARPRSQTRPRTQAIPRPNTRELLAKHAPATSPDRPSPPASKPGSSRPLRVVPPPKKSPHKSPERKEVSRKTASKHKTRVIEEAKARHPSAPVPAGPPPPFKGIVPLLLLLTAAFSLIGLIMVLSSSMVIDYDNRGSPLFHFRRQLIWMGLGWGLLIFTSLVDYRRWAKFATPMLVVSLGLLGLVLVPGLGVTINGATRWLQLGPIVFQPAEIAKFALIVWVARLLASRNDHIRNPRLSVRPVLLVLALMGLLILGQPSLGSTVVVATIVFTMLLVAGCRMGSLFRWGSLGLSGLLLLSFTADYRRQRLIAFLDPWDDPFGSDYQSIQSMVSIASGGLNGLGLGAGRAKWGYLPFSNTDFIFAVIAEELGFIGAAITILLFMLLVGIGVHIATRAPSNFAFLLIAGFVTWMVVQFFINVGATLGLLPITGVPIPFLSFGGSALMFNMAAMGVIINIARQGRKVAMRDTVKANTQEAVTSKTATPKTATPKTATPKTGTPKAAKVSKQKVAK